MISSAGEVQRRDWGVRPAAWKFEVTGIFETGMYEYDNRYMYVALDVAQRSPAWAPA